MSARGPYRRRSPGKASGVAQSRRPAVPLEKVEQAHIVAAARAVGGVVYVLGTTRRGSTCPGCGTWVQGHMGTQQTPGIPDLEIYLPCEQGERELVKWEVKRATGARFSPEQVAYRTICVDAGVLYGAGSLDDFLRLLVDRGLVKADTVPHYRRQEATHGSD